MHENGSARETAISHPIRCALISDFTVDGLVPLLSSQSDPPAFETRSSPFGQVMQMLVDEHATPWSFQPDIAIVWTRPESVIESFGRLKDGQPVNLDQLLLEVDIFVNALKAAARRVTAVLVPSWTSAPYDRGTGVINLSPVHGSAYFLLRMNAHLAEVTATAGNIHVLDAGRWVALAGQNAVSPKLWHLGKILFGPEVLRHAALDIKAAARAMRGQIRKIAVLDLDDTLWGGIVGDVGWENLQLGGHHPVGEAFVSFQRALKALTNRGVVLGIVSKNSETVALEAIDRHPEMILRRGDFAAWRINWEDKARNLIDLMRELNLGLDAAVFIDDSAVERARVRQALPDVLVPEWPADKLLYEKALAELTCFDTFAISEEDRARTKMYASERLRHSSRTSTQSLEDYLASLNLRVHIEPLGADNVKRAAQLLNKTNQMNLRTRRLSELEFLEFCQGETVSAYCYRVSDRFDDYGLTGLASVKLVDGSAQVLDFVLSCRVMGRGVEQVIVHSLIDRARAQGAERFTMEYAATARNGPCKAFLEEQSRLTRVADTVYAWDTNVPYAGPTHIVVTDTTAASVPSVAVEQDPVR
jgi:FkbH-like protein